MLLRFIESSAWACSFWSIQLLEIDVSRWVGGRGEVSMTSYWLLVSQRPWHCSYARILLISDAIRTGFHCLIGFNSRKRLKRFRCCRWIGVLMIIAWLVNLEVESWKSEDGSGLNGKAEAIRFGSDKTREWKQNWHSDRQERKTPSPWSVVVG